MEWHNEADVDNFTSMWITLRDAKVQLIITSQVPVEGKSSVCLICLKYRIIILIIIIISLGQILLSYIENTPRTHACTLACTRAHTHTLARVPAHEHAHMSMMSMHEHARVHTHTHTHTTEPFRLALCDGSVVPNRDGPFRWRQWASLLHSNKHMRGRSGLPRFCVFFAYKKIARPN